jgi:hypothetical protein
MTIDHITLPAPVVRTKEQLLEDFGGGQPEQLSLRNFVETTFSVASSETVPITAVGDARAFGTAVTMTSGLKVLTVAGGTFTGADVGKTIGVQAVGPSGGGLITTITACSSATQVTLAIAASTTRSAFAVSDDAVVVGTDDTVAFSNDLNAAAMAGGVLHYPTTAKYLLTSSVIGGTARGVKVQGNGATLYFLFTGDGSGINYVYADDLRWMDWNSDGCGRYGSTNSNHFSGNNPRRVTISNCHHTDGTGGFILYQINPEVRENLTDNHIEHCNVDGRGRGSGLGCMLSGLSYSSIIDCHVRGGNRIAPNPGYGQELKQNCYACQIVDGIVEDWDIGFVAASQDDHPMVTDCQITNFFAVGCRSGITTGYSSNCYFSGTVDQQSQGERAVSSSAFSTTNCWDIAIYNMADGFASIRTYSDKQVYNLRYHDGSGDFLWEIGSGVDNSRLNIGYYDSSSSSFNPQTQIVDSSGMTTNTWSSMTQFYNTPAGSGSIRLSGDPAGSMNTSINTASSGFGANTVMSIRVNGTDLLHINKGDLRVVPASDNTISCGSASSRWTTVYAATGSINTSDARLKTPVVPLKPEEIAAAKALAVEIGTFQFLDAIALKGEAEARLHVGLTVQRAMEIMTAKRLDPFRYGFICHDVWEDQYIDGVLVKPAGDIYSFRPDELALFLARGFDARLAALEASAPHITGD